MDLNKQEDEFSIEAETMQVFTCKDGAQFHTIQEAREHTQALKAAHEAALQKAQMEKEMESYLNSLGYTGRNRVQKQTIVRSFLEWKAGWDGEFIPLVIEEPKVEVPVEVPEVEEEEVTEEEALLEDILSVDTEEETELPFDSPASDILVDFEVSNPDTEVEEDYDPYRVTGADF